MSEIVETDLRRRQVSQFCSDLGVRTEITEQTVTNASSRKATKLLLDEFDAIGRALCFANIEHNRIHGSEPADSPRDADFLEDLFPPAAFELHDQLRLAG